MKTFDWLLMATALQILFCFDTTYCFVTMIPVLNKVVSKFDERLINISYVFEHPESITNQSLSYEAHVLRELKDMKMTVAYYVVSSESMNRLLKRTVDVCSYVKRPNSDRLVKVLYDHMARNNRLPSFCPIPARERFYIRDLRPAAITIPGFLPENNFIFDTSFHTGALLQPLFQLRYHGRLMRIINGNIFPTVQPQPSTRPKSPMSDK
uniref:Uncharacterized protein n=1 Tax=Anopheles arabiensis TaxID=7173 RepID=A0A2C9GRC5_ANOAR